MNEPITHDRAFALLPWLANGTLAAAERDLVELHVRGCLSCHRELKEQQRLRAALRAQPAVHISAQSGFEKLARELGRVPTLPVKAPRPLATFKRFAVVGAAGVTLLGALLWLVPLPSSDGNAALFETLAAQPSAGGAPALDVIFVQSVTAAEMQQLLGEIDGSIAAGPSDVGRYTVRLDGAHAGAEVDAVLARLQKDSRVRFASRSLAPASKP